MRCPYQFLQPLGQRLGADRVGDGRVLADDAGAIEALQLVVHGDHALARAAEDGVVDLVGAAVADQVLLWTSCSSRKVIDFDVCPVQFQEYQASGTVATC